MRSLTKNVVCAMSKKSFLVLLTVLYAAGAVMAQTDRRPAADGQKSASDNRKFENVQQHAEEKSDGAAFSGKGRGGDKDLREKEKKGRKGKRGHKAHREEKQHRGKHERSPADEDKPGPTPETKPQPNGGENPAPTPRRRAGERPTSGAEPKQPPRRQ